MSIQSLREIMQQPSTWNHATIPRVHIEAALQEIAALEAENAALKAGNDKLQEYGKQTLRRATTAEARLADAIRMYELVASDRTKELVESANARADAAVQIAAEYRSIIALAREQLNDLLIDEDLDDEKLREASEALLPNMVDEFSKVLAAALLPVRKEGE